jgi:hypothetical protein
MPQEDADYPVGGRRKGVAVAATYLQCLLLGGKQESLVEQ